MNKRSASDKFKPVYALMLFALALFVIGCILRTRIGLFLRSYTENQTRKQAEAYALLMSEKLDTELMNLEYIASLLENSPDDMDDLMPEIYNDPETEQGLLMLDGKALYGKSLDASVFAGIQNSFRGRKDISYAKEQGLLFTCPVFNGTNIRYVLYRLCPVDSLEQRFSAEMYDDLGKICVTTRDGQIIVPCHNCSDEDVCWYEREDIRKMYSSMHPVMEVSAAVAKTFSTDRGDMLLFEAEIPGTEFLLSGYVPKAVAAEGIGNVTLLVAWVFGLLMLLVMIGAVYLTRASIKIRESNELREAKMIAEAASRAKSDFLANMSHEIRTPINAVLGMNEMILRESGDDAIISYASNIKTAGQTLLGLINDILDFSKIESGKIEIVPGEYDLSAMLNDLVNMIRPRAESKGLNMILDFDAALPKMLYGDAGRIRQVITNLLTNAVKYTEKGSVAFVMKFEKTTKEPEYVSLKVFVKDTGVGIRQEDMGRLFTKFERLEERKNHSIEGSGLGLNITQSLLALMGSALQVESEYGKGSMFYFTLKQKIIGEETLGDYQKGLTDSQEVREKYREKFMAKDARVLVVDDNPMNLMVFKSLVKQTGVKIHTAESGDEGIRLSAEMKYDMIFLDHMMPNKDGIETLHEIRENADNPNAATPAVCLTANAIAGSREEYLSEGFDDYLSKPIDTEKLEDMMLHFLPSELIEMRTEEEESTGEEGQDFSQTIGALDTGYIDTGVGLKNSGSAEIYLALLRVFYESIEEKTEELNRYYESEDYRNYTIRIHALKSSAKIIGALSFGEKAQLLEDAGKAGNTEMIRTGHPKLMEEYRGFEEILSVVFPKEETKEDKPEADGKQMKAAYEEICMAADSMDCDWLDNIFKGMEKYRIPEMEAQRYEKVKKAAEKFEYDVILSLIKGKNE